MDSTGFYFSHRDNGSPSNWNDRESLAKYKRWYGPFHYEAEAKLFSEFHLEVGPDKALVEFYTDQEVKMVEDLPEESVEAMKARFFDPRYADCKGPGNPDSDMTPTKVREIFAKCLEDGKQWSYWFGGLSKRTVDDMPKVD